MNKSRAALKDFTIQVEAMKTTYKAYMRFANMVHELKMGIEVFPIFEDPYTAS